MQEAMCTWLIFVLLPFMVFLMVLWAPAGETLEKQHDDELYPRIDYKA